ncbi:MAG: hypothetical protein N2578_07530, partial [Bdellovibrionaceae bacterium]|nr:hypothetical protein [Pseudobdellovibrionaceae bacterium]
MSLFARFQSKDRLHRQNQILGFLIIFVSLMAPVGLAVLLEMQVNPLWAGLAVMGFLFLAFWLQHTRNKILKKIEERRLGFAPGCLLKKRRPIHELEIFEITGRGGQFVYLRSQSSGQRIVVSQRRIQE